MVTAQHAEAHMGKYKIGHPGGPGRPRGSRNKLSQLLEDFVNRHGQQALDDIADKARGGENPWASKAMLKLICDRAGNGAVPIELPEIANAESLAKSQSDVIRAAADGDLPLPEAVHLGSLLELQRRAVITLDHERRLEEIEKAIAAKSEGGPHR
jgi:hypothetical protein